MCIGGCRSWHTCRKYPRRSTFRVITTLAHFHRTGPFHDGAGREPVAFPWERLTGEPLIYASMGTLQNGQADTFRAILAATERPGYQVVLSVGMNTAPGEPCARAAGYGCGSTGPTA